MGQFVSTSNNNIPSSDTTNIILAKIYNSSCKTRSIKSLVRNLNPVILMNLKAILLKDLLHNPKLNSRKFNRYACILAEIDQTMNSLRRDSISNQVIRVPSHYEEETAPTRQMSQSKPRRQLSQTPSQGMTANYNLTLCHSSSTDEPIRMPLPPPPPPQMHICPPSAPPMCSAPPYYDDK